MRITTYRMELNDDDKSVLVKENSQNYSALDRLDCPAAVVKMANDVFGLNSLAEEHVCMAAINNQNKVVGVFEISHGAVDISIATPREVYMRALLCGACKIFLILDSLIVTRDNYYSFADNGLL